MSRAQRLGGAVAAPRVRRDRAVALVFLVAPTVIVLLTSFTASASLNFPPHGLFAALVCGAVDADQMQDAAWNSLVVAVWTTIASVVIGTAGALAIARSRAQWARLRRALMSPLVLPALAFGFAGLMYIHLIGLSPLGPVLIVGHVVVCLPFVMRTTVAALAQLDPGLLEASASLGATQLTTFRRVTLPLIGEGSPPERSSRSWRRSTTCRCRSSWPTRAPRCCPSTCGRSSTRISTCAPPRCPALIVIATLVLMILAERFAGLSRQLSK